MPLYENHLDLVNNETCISSDKKSLKNQSSILLYQEYFKINKIRKIYTHQYKLPRTDTAFVDSIFTNACWKYLAPVSAIQVTIDTAGWISNYQLAETVTKKAWPYFIGMKKRVNTLQTTFNYSYVHEGQQLRQVTVEKKEDYICFNNKKCKQTTLITYTLDSMGNIISREWKSQQQFAGSHSFSHVTTKYVYNTDNRLVRRTQYNHVDSTWELQLVKYRVEHLDTSRFYKTMPLIYRGFMSIDEVRSKIFKIAQTILHSDVQTYHCKGKKEEIPNISELTPITQYEYAILNKAGEKIIELSAYSIDTAYTLNDFSKKILLVENLYKVYPCRLSYVESSAAGYMNILIRNSYPMDSIDKVDVLKNDYLNSSRYLNTPKLRKMEAAKRYGYTDYINNFYATQDLGGLTGSNYARVYFLSTAFFEKFQVRHRVELLPQYTVDSKNRTINTYSYEFYK